MLECPLVAISGHAERCARESALPPKADIQIAIPHQPLTNVRFTPNSGHKWAPEFMSAYDPERTLTTLGAYGGRF